MPPEVVYKPIEEVKPIYAGGTLQPPKFMPSFYEWLSFKSEQIIRQGENGGGGTALLYTIPATHTFFLTSICLDAYSDGTNSQASAWVETIQNQMPLIQVEVSSDGVGANTIMDSNALSVVYPIPLKFNGGEVLQVNTDGAVALGRATITGFLVQNNDIPTF